MRVTNRMMANNYLSDMKRNLNNLNKINGQLATGKEINRASDNPFKAARSMQLNSSISSNKQYQTNISDTINWLDTTDEALGEVTNVLQRVRELMVTAGNAAYGSDESKAINEEIKERTSELTQILNTNFDGRYLFGGTKTTSKPVDIITDSTTQNNEIVFLDGEGERLFLNNTETYTAHQVNNLSGKMNVEISQSVSLSFNVTAMEILKFTNEDGESIDAIDLFKDIQKNLSSETIGDRTKVTGENLTALDDMITNLLSIRAEVGAKQNRMESALSKNEDENYNMTQVLSNTEDIDFTEKTIEYSMAQTTYTAALQVSAQVLTKTLLDYL